jgi:transcriptional regulator with XRE-family HTH domain
MDHHKPKGDRSRRNPPRSTGPLLHRLREVRRQQGVSLRTMARKLGTSVASIRLQETCVSDLKLSDLLRWQEALEVPIGDLLVEPNLNLSPAIQQRACLLRAMKTAVALKEKARTEETSQLAQELVEQLVQIMPELKDVGGWHTVGRRRTLAEFGRILELIVREEIFWTQESNE